MGTKPILVSQFGSHVYGTNTPSSDHDYKGVFIPEARDILLQRTPKQIITNSKGDSNRKNSPNDTDREMFSLQQFFKLLMEGQTPALDLLFTPQQWWILDETSFTRWLNVQQFCKQHLLHRGTSAFVGYTQQQAAKYGIKGSRIAAVRSFLDTLRDESVSQASKLHQHWERFKLWAGGREHAEFVWINNPAGVPEEYISVCGRKLNGSVTVKHALEIFQRVFDEYGERARMAESNEGIDWKALMHAVRVAGEAEELLLTGNITFPRPNAEFLVKIRTGQLPYKQVAEIIEQGLATIDAAKAKSILPEAPNRSAAEQFLFEYYRGKILDYDSA